MSLNGIGGLPPGYIGGSPLPLNNTNTTDRARPQVEQAAPAPSTTQTNAAAASPHSTALPAEAPQGTDPELWKVLTSDERQHFATAGARGPLTYGYLGRTQSAPPATPARGVRLDLRA